jgi:5'-methylthioadenosine phosphorylase
MDFAVIGGTGFYDFFAGAGVAEQVTTRYGTVTFERGEAAGQEVVFLPRHGKDHGVPPHRVNYRANLAALRELGVRSVLASAAVGSMHEAMPPGSLALLTQFLDFTRGRPGTFYDGDEGGVVHTDMSVPYCPRLREGLLSAAAARKEGLLPAATYVCAEGPRFETPAEIRMYRQLGGDVVGMTGVPEVVLAREAGICYASIAIVTNWAAGVTLDPIKHGEVTDFMGAQTPRVVALFRDLIAGPRGADAACCAGA